MNGHLRIDMEETEDGTNIAGECKFSNASRVEKINLLLCVFKVLELDIEPKLLAELMLFDSLKNELSSNPTHEVSIGIDLRNFKKMAEEYFRKHKDEA